MNPHDVTTQIPVILCIDLEPDEFFVDRKDPKPWSGFEFAHDYLKTFRSRFEEATGHRVHFSWSLRMDPQVAIGYGSATWVADKYSAFLEEYRSLGDDLGIHVHTYRWSDKEGGWLDDCGNPEWVSECLRSSVESFKKVFGEPSRSLRFGNFWLSTQAINEAESLGLEFDLTVEPGLRPSPRSVGKPPRSVGKPPKSGPSPDYYRVPRVPYQPSRDDFHKPARDGYPRTIRMVPLTSSHTRLGWDINGLRQRISRVRNNGIRGELQSVPLSMWRKWDGQNSYTAMLDRAIAVQKRPYLAFATEIHLELQYSPFPGIRLKNK
jgi:hypothetical protein